MRFITLDTETTGFSPKNGDRIVEVAALLFDASGNELDRFQTLLWPDRDVPSRAEAVHGLSVNKLRGAPRFKDIASDLAGFLAQADSWAHNATFDSRFLVDEFDRANTAWNSKISCSLKLAKETVPGPHKLADLAARAGWVWEGRGAHSAIEDARALGRVMSMLWSLNAPTPVRPAPTHTNYDARFDEVITLEPTQRGKLWTKDADAALKAAWLANNTLGQVCAAFGRTPAAIALRLEHLNVVDAHPFARRRG